MSALIASADSRLISDFAALESEQSTAQVQAQAGGTYLSGAYLSSTRSRVVNYADSFFIFVSDEAIRLTNDGTLFSRTDLIALLDSYRNDWQLYLDQFFASSLFNGHSTNSLDSIKTEIMIFVEDKILFEINFLDSFGRLTAAPQPSIEPPTADAGIDQTVEEGTTVSLSGAGADIDGFIASFSWQQDSGPAVVITRF